MPGPIIYDVSPNQSDSHQVSAWWTMCIVRYAHLRTLDHELLANSWKSHPLDVSDPRLAKDPAEERAPIILGSQILSWSTSENKGSYASSANFRLAPVAQLDRMIAAGDWVLFWAHDTTEDRDRVLRSIRKIASGQAGEEERSVLHAQEEGGQGVTANGPHDGLRFVGRVNSPKESREIDPASGAMRTSYEMTAVGFGELGAKVYYSPAYTARLGEALIPQLAQLAQLVDKALADNIPLTTAEHFQLWLTIFLGSGPGAASKGFSADQIDEGVRDTLGVDGQVSAADVAGLTLSPNEAYLVPRTAALLLGLPTNAKQTYASMLQTFVGIQAPGSGASGGLRDMVMQAVLEGGKPIPPPGTFRPQTNDFNDSPVWDLLSKYSNVPVNEIFTSLRLTDTGVRPTLVLRQTPYSSIEVATTLSQEGFPVTAFYDLPRWRIDPALTLGQRLGPSDSMRFNYVAIQGTVVGETGILDPKLINTVFAPPVADRIDILRHGVHTYVRQVNADITGVIASGTEKGDVTARGRLYNTLLADIAMKGHLKWNGTLRCVGIVEPIAVGDNLEYGGVVYQIEGRQDSGSIDAGGRKTWSTTFSLSNGISAAIGQTGDLMPHEEMAPDEIRMGITSDLRDDEFEGPIDFTSGEQELRESMVREQAARPFAELPAEQRGLPPLHNGKPTR